MLKATTRARVSKIRNTKRTSAKPPDVSKNKAKRFTPIEERIDLCANWATNSDALLKLFVIIKSAATSKIIRLTIPVEENFNILDLVNFPRRIKPV
jgi:hypothetical protein